MEEFLNHLEELFQREDVEMRDNIYFSENDELVSMIIGEANKILISCSGMVNAENIKVLRDKGYRVYPGEKDGFGWLTGCIAKSVNFKKKILVFG